VPGARKVGHGLAAGQFPEARLVCHDPDGMAVERFEVKDGLVAELGPCQRQARIRLDRYLMACLRLLDDLSWPAEL
jgi:hypothetical protein